MLEVSCCLRYSVPNAARGSRSCQGNRPPKIGTPELKVYVENRRHAVGAKAGKPVRASKIKRFRTAPYSVVNANFRKFDGIFRDGAELQ